MWWLIGVMAAMVFVSRYVFLEPKLPFKLSDQWLHFLEYTSPALLTAIWAPIVFNQSNKLNLELQNPYLMAASLAVALAIVTRNVLLTTLLSMLFFFYIKVL